MLKLVDTKAVLVLYKTIDTVPYVTSETKP